MDAPSQDEPLIPPGPRIADHFRGFLPVVIDVETGGFNKDTDALLEIAAVFLRVEEDGRLVQDDALTLNVEPFEGANIEQAALDFTGIQPFSALRGAVPEREALTTLFRAVRQALRQSDCNRAVLVGHNAHFDHGFMQAAAQRQDLKRNPFHPFSSFDTVTLAGLAYGQTVLARACQAAGIAFDSRAAHSALYDAQKTAELFCAIVNRWHGALGWPQEQIRD